MKKILFSTLFLATVITAHSQAILNSWIMNANGKKASFWANNGGQPPTYTFTNSNDSADVLKVCYTTDSVWVRSQNMTDNMGKWFNPGSAVSQNWVHRFPRNPQPATTHTTSPVIGEIGMLTNGIAIYGLSNANSWTGSANATPQQGGQGIWNVEVGLSEGFVLDTAFGAHPQQQGVYHSHTTPFRLYKNSPTTKHSPLVGWAFDGYPIYGPYGYSTAMDSTSAVTRMRTGYSLRNITTRTTMPGGAAATQTGPPVNTTYPIGTYCEDYEWLSTNGDLDQYNGRTCITPEFPQGTYAYFVTMDATGKAQFPYYIGMQYYGKADTKNFPAGPSGNGLSIPSAVTNCILPTGGTSTGALELNSGKLLVYPNPSLDGNFNVLFNNKPYTKVSVLNNLGQVIYTAATAAESTHTFTLNESKGIYLLVCEDADGRTVVNRLLVK